MNYLIIKNTIQDKYPYVSFFLLCVLLVIIALITIYGFKIKTPYSSSENRISHCNRLHHCPPHNLHHHNHLYR